MRKLFRFIADLFLRPSVRIGLGVLVTGGFIAGVLSWQGFNTAMEATNKEEFCISCHTMHDNLLPELQKTEPLAKGALRGGFFAAGGKGGGSGRPFLA